MKEIPLVKPFLKWAGSKRLLVSTLKELLPRGNRLIEPFVGSGTVFLNLDYPSYLLNDSNADLINLFHIIAQEGKKFIRDTKKYFIDKNNTQERYNELREEFNSTRSGYKKAMLFIYLNRHGYNGLCRYNSRGKFNVPFGRHKVPYFPEENLLNFAQMTKNIELHCQDFREIFKKAVPGDVIYCDPPYVSVNSSPPINYEGKLFAENDQMDLAKSAYEASLRGIPVLISNHDTPFTREIYHQAKTSVIQVKRFISCQANNRQPVKEILALYGA